MNIGVSKFTFFSQYESTSIFTQRNIEKLKFSRQERAFIETWVPNTL